MTPALSWHPPRSTNPTRIARLTPRQADVLTGLCLGLPNQTIADRLHLSLETIKSHTKAVLQATHANSRAHAVHLVYTGEVTVVVKASTAYHEAMRRHPAGRRLPGETA